MKKVAIIIMILTAGFVGHAQSVSLPQANIDPAPLEAVQNNGTGVASFTFAESSGINVPAIAFGMPNVTISVNLQFIELTNFDASLVTGTLLNFFTVSYDSVTNILLFEQSVEIPGDSFGSVEFPITVIQNSLQSQALNGFNANIASIDGMTNAEGNASVFTYTTGNTGTVDITDFSIPGDTLDIVVTDGDLNEDPLVVETVDVVVVNDVTGESEIITLTETGPDTGIFTGTVDTTFGTVAGTDNDGVFNTQAGDTVTVTYDDEFDGTGNDPDPITDTDIVGGGITGTVDITDFSIPGDTLDIVVTDGDLNEDPLVIETVDVVVVNDVTGEIEIITLTETGPDTGVFTGTVDTTFGTVAGTDNDGVFNTQAGDTVTVTYDDELDTAGNDPAPITDTDIVGGGITGTVDITDTSLPGDTLDIVVTDNDLNEDPLVIETIDVVVVNDVTGESEIITLTETGPDTGVFTGTVDTTYGTTAGTDNDGVFNTQEADTVTVTYDDEFDAAGNDPAPVTDTDIVGALPDYSPTIFSGNTTIIGDTGVVDFRVFVGEFANQSSVGPNPVELRIIKNTQLFISYDDTLTSINGSPVDNSDWVYDATHPSLHRFTYVGNGGVFPGSTASNIGINAIYNPPSSTNGSFPLKVTIKFFSGGEINNTNNDDTDIIEYNNN